jgi:hypothetical protein
MNAKPLLLPFPDKKPLPVEMVTFFTPGICKLFPEEDQK